MNPHESLVGAASGMLMYIHYYMYVCAYAYMWLARLYLKYSSVAVDRDGNWLERKDLAWYLGLIRRYEWARSRLTS